MRNYTNRIEYLLSKIQDVTELFSRGTPQEHVDIIKGVVCPASDIRVFG
jgi:hypothetical protein